MPDRPVVALDISVLLRLPGLDVVQGTPCFLDQIVSVELMQSGPLSTLMASELPRHPMISLSDWTTHSAVALAAVVIYWI